MERPEKIYRICSTIKFSQIPSKTQTTKLVTAWDIDIKEKFIIQERTGFIFKRWNTIASGCDVTDSSMVVRTEMFKSYDDAEKYLMINYSKLYDLIKEGNIYKLYMSNMYF